jgi:hypothetical protein
VYVELEDDDETPRLADLPGRVVRVTHLVEMHVPDPRAFVAWMRADGWEPLPADQLPAEDIDAVVGAVQAATDDLPPLAGVRSVTDTSTAPLSDPAAGDELLDWSPSPVIVDLGTGWRTSPHCRRRGPDMWWVPVRHPRLRIRFPLVGCRATWAG